MSLQSVSQFLVNTLLIRKVPRHFLLDSGHCWVASIPHLARRGDHSEDKGRSPFLLYEDGVPLIHAHSVHDDIRKIGKGTYSHWQDRLFFSATDNSNPNTNGRTYTYSMSPWLYKKRIGERGSLGSPPVNYRLLDTEPSSIQNDVSHALRTGYFYRDALQSYLPSLSGKTVLDVGPGINFGAVMVLSAYGAKPMVADRFLAPWQPDYHTQFYSALADRLAADPRADVSSLRAIVEAGGYLHDTPVQVEAPLESLPIKEGTVDCVVTAAVVEHLFDQGVAFEQAFRITRPGGFGFHFVDFRDHRNFERPLEYLLLSNKDFHDLFERNHGECGNQYRPDETATFARDAGFEILHTESTLWANPRYLNEFVPRLRTMKHSRYRERPQEDLQPLFVNFWLRKPV